MKKKLWNLFKAFMTGFIVVAAVLLLLQILAPVLGFELQVGWKATFELEKSAKGVVHASWLAPITVGLIFAAIQLVDDFESSISRQYKKRVKSRTAREAVTILWHGFWGLTIGFVMSMFLLAVLSGSSGTYSIPFFFTATAQGNAVTATTSIITICTVLGIVWGVWKAEHLPKEKKKAKPRKQKKK
ncbi:MAG: hypothetical protein KAW41_04160 [Candidatus Diapherotrites archaeon]|nr:hypothetical protein [Candidatus Diapherotrites archaeon]